MTLALHAWADMDAEARKALLTRPAAAIGPRIANEVAAVVEDVRRRGDTAVREYTARFDQTDLATSRVEEAEFAWAEVALSRTAHRAATTASKVAAKRSGVIMLATSAISMIVGGATALLVLGRYRMPAASLMLAGLFALLVLIPRVRTWVEDRTARGNGAAAAFASAEKEHS